jgi:hypothetical protein
VQKLKEAFGDDLNIYGKGQNPIDDKADASRAYKYNIVIENSIHPDYWTEKLSDCYLEEAFPFYAGCPNIDRYFSPDAYTPINLDDSDGAIEIIRAAITENRFEKSRAAVREARRKVLDEYNLFNLITDHIDSLAPIKNPPDASFKAYPPNWFTRGWLIQGEIDA